MDMPLTAQYILLDRHRKARIHTSVIQWTMQPKIVVPVMQSRHASNSAYGTGLYLSLL